jgi:hypothetical protein
LNVIVSFERTKEQEEKAALPSFAMFSDVRVHNVNIAVCLSAGVNRKKLHNDAANTA